MRSTVPVSLVIGLRQVNSVLTLLVLVLALYIVFFPFLPSVGRWLSNPGIQTQAVIQVTKNNPLTSTPISSENTIKIPRLNLTEVIHTGPSVYELSKGPWLIPNTSTPDKESNTVIAGHRFTYAGPAVFYFLDQLQVNDRITIDWQHKQYTYKVATISVVPPNRLSIQNSSAQSQLTLFTCTPLVTAKNRLVIVAPLVGVRS